MHALLFLGQSPPTAIPGPPTSFGISAMLAIVFSGVVLIATHTVLQMIRERLDRRALERKTLDELLHPLLDATDDLISRLTQFIANKQISAGVEDVSSDPFLATSGCALCTPTN